MHRHIRHWLFIAAVAVPATAAQAQVVLRAIPHGADAFGSAAVVDPATNRVFFASVGEQLTVIDGEDESISALASRSTLALAMDPAARKLYRTGSTISVIDLDTLAEHALPGTFPNTWSAAVDALHGDVHVLAPGVPELMIVDGATEQVRHVPLPGINAVGVAVDPLARRAIVAMRQPSSGFDAPVHVVDAASATITRSVPLTGARGTSVTVDPLTGTMFASGQRTPGLLLAFDAAGNPPSSFSIGPSPRNLLLDVIDRRLSFANTEPSLQSLDLTDPTPAIASLPTGGALDGIVIDASNGARYAPVVDGPLLRIDRGGGSIALAAPSVRGVVVANPITHRVYAFDDTHATIIDGVQPKLSSVPLGAQPGAVALDRVRGTVAVLDEASDTVRLVAPDGSVQTIAAGDTTDVAIDARTGTIHVANRATATVTRIGAGGTVAGTTAVQGAPAKIAVDSARGHVYVLAEDGTLTTIPASGAASSQPAGGAPVALVVDEPTGTVYVLTATGLVARRLNGTTTPVAIGTMPVAMSLDDRHRKLFVANAGSGDVTVVDLAGGASTSVVIGGTPDAIAVNRTSGRAYVVRRATDRIIEIAPNGLTRTVTLRSGAVVAALAVDDAANTVFALDGLEPVAHVIDGPSLAAHVIATGASPRRLVVDPARHRTAIVNAGGASLTVIDRDDQSSQLPLDVAVAVSATASAAPVVRFTPGSDYGVGAPDVPVLAVFYQVDAITGTWQQAQRDGDAWTATLGSLAPGTHTVFAFALDALSGTSFGPGDGYTARVPTSHVGRVVALPFVRAEAVDMLFANGFE